MLSFVQLLAVTPAANAEGDIVGEITKTFHVDWPFFGAQCVSFLIVAFLLWKFAFGPVQKMLEQRKDRIAAGEEKLKVIEKQLAESERTTAEAIEKANAEAKRLIEEARSGAATLSEQKAAEALSQAQSIIAKAQLAAQAERSQLMSELKSEFGRLVTATTAQVTGKVLNDDDKKRLNEEALAKVEA